MSVQSYIKCPFCADDDFDLIGLKMHLSGGCCDAYEALETPEPLSPDSMFKFTKSVAPTTPHALD